MPYFSYALLNPPTLLTNLILGDIILPDERGLRRSNERVTYVTLSVTTVDKLPRATRNKKRSLEGTSEWAELKAKFAEGLRPYEAVYVSFTPAQQTALGIKTAHRIFLEMAKGYVRKLRLPYDVWKYKSEGQEFVCVAARGVDGSAAPKTMPAVQQHMTPVRGKKRKTA